MFFFMDTATTESYTYGHTLSLHDALPISGIAGQLVRGLGLLRGAGRAAADLVGMGVRRGRRRDPPRRAQGSRVARAHPQLVLAALQPRPAASRPADAQSLGRAGPARPGLGVDGRFLVAAGFHRPPSAG